ncbi:hypothetical protein HD554DRAFT_1503392 [Boletus coccyginus]|nr:hypothetical protein HD554DRAFT_1503392 [Boletus coccyginus]
MDPNSENINTPPCGPSLYPSCKERVSVNERIKRATQVLHLSRLSLLSAPIIVPDPSLQNFANTGIRYMYLHQLPDNIFVILWAPRLLAWMEPHSIEYVSKKVYSEMDSIKATRADKENTVRNSKILAKVAYNLLRRLRSDSCGPMEHQGRRSKPLRDVDSPSFTSLHLYFCRTAVQYTSKDPAENICGSHQCHCVQSKLLAPYSTTISVRRSSKLRLLLLVTAVSRGCRL